MVIASPRTSTRQNFTYDPKTHTFANIDNTQNHSAGTLTDKELINAMSDTRTVIGFETARSAFNVWTGQVWVDELVSNVDKLADRLVTNYLGIYGDGSTASGFGILYPYEPSRAKSAAANPDTAVKKQIYPDLLNIAKASRPKMVAAAKAGLAVGRTHVMAQLADPMPFTKGLDDQQRQTAATSLLARRMYLGGASQDKAWEDAHAKVLSLMGKKFVPAAPALNTMNMPSLAAAEASGKAQKAGGKA